jgi:hypothetical protein
MARDSENQVKISGGDATPEGLRARIVPKDLDMAHRPFEATAKKKCYVIYDKGPPPVLTEVDCGDIVIVDEKFVG